MKLRITAATLAVGVLCLLGVTPAHARWEKVKAYLQTGTEVVEETDERIVLRDGSQDAAIELVLTAEWTPESDVYGDIAVRRGGNPYRIWVVSERLAADPQRPRPQWGRLLRAEFLRLLRSPRAKQLAR
jgi:hypothetical protein